MKSVQMRINPELYAQFKRVGGESNNERMEKLLDDSREKYGLIGDISRKNSDIKQWRCECIKAKDEANKSMCVAIVSLMASVLSVAYVCVDNGWLL